MLALAGGVQAQQPDRFRSGVELVALDVSVVDRTGRPVSDLTPGDFTVTVDGRPRRVVSAHFIDHLAPPTPGTMPSLPPDTGRPSTAMPGVPAPVPGRNVFIVLDEDTLETEAGMVARRAAVALLDGLSLEDRVGINTVPRLRANFTLTTDRIANRKALLDWVPGGYEEPPGQFWIGASEAFEIEGNDQITRDKVIARECGGQPAGRLANSCAREVVQEARQLAVRLHARGTAVLDALRALGRGLRRLPGPKTLVLVSGGVYTPESNGAFKLVEEELAAAEITLYTLFFEKSEYHAGRYKLSPTIGADDRLMEDGLANVTSAAGGTFLRVVGSAEAPFGQVARALSGSYVLGIDVEAPDRDGKPHRVAITVTRAGVDVHGRKQYVIPAIIPGRHDAPVQ